MIRSGAIASAIAPARIEGVERRPVERPAVALEVPPRDPVLGRQHDGVRAEQGGKIAGDGGDLVRLDPEDHQVLGTAFLQPAGGGDVRGVNDGAVVHRHLEAAGADRIEMSPPRDEGDVLARRGEPCAEQSADGSRPHHANFHGALLLRNWSGPRVAPTSVVGITSICGA